MKHLITILTIIGFSTLITAQTKQYKWDAIHSNINFKVAYLKISEVSGRFTKSTGNLTYADKNFTDALLNVIVQVSSINTDDEKRDGHLKSSDFFDAEKFPTITFKSSSFKKIKGNMYKVTGKLTMKGITKTLITTANYL